MKIYKTQTGIVISQNDQYLLLPNANWDHFINDDVLYAKVQQLLSSSTLSSSAVLQDILPPIGQQELWACGVTYLRSKVGRQEESKDAGGGDFYARVYEAERPEVFFKSTAHRVVGHGGTVCIRKDSTWDVPEPELTLVVTSSGKIVGYTIGNDMSSRSIEGENPLYLPQAKTYDGCASVGPCIFVTEGPIDMHTQIHLTITRKQLTVFTGSVGIDQIKRGLEELVSFVYRACSFPYGSLIMTGTGIVPPHNFTLLEGDVITIAIDGIGELMNVVGAPR